MDVYIIEDWKSKVNRNEPKGKWATNLIESTFENIQIKKDGRGKPSIVGEDKYINWGHTERFLVIAFSMIGNIGVDVEDLIIPYDESLYGWTLHEQEKSKLKMGTLFSEVWTRKEAVLKCTGEGIHEKMNEFSSYQLPDFTVTTFFIEGNCVSVCTEYDEAIECIVC